jgi:hypothetical protein
LLGPPDQAYRDEPRQLGFKFFEIRDVLLGPPLQGCGAWTPILHENSEINVTVGSMISAHAAAEKINVIKTHRRLAPLGYNLSKYSQFVALLRIHPQLPHKRAHARLLEVGPHPSDRIVIQLY